MLHFTWERAERSMQATGLLDETLFDPWHVPNGEPWHWWCNCCCMACRLSEPCDCCDLDPVEVAS